MRESKFRLWDKNKQNYLVDDRGFRLMYLRNGSTRFFNPEVWEFEQYTGVKDKNGTEIYEGDIIAQELIDDPFAGGYPTYIVCWDEKFLGWALKDATGDDGNDTDLHFFIGERRKCEIIGNIHENPELLEASV